MHNLSSSLLAAHHAAQGTAISYSRAKVALTALQPPYASDVRLTRLQGARGIGATAAIAGLAVLPCSRIIVVGGEDGIVKICG